jgi:hypothetical protein
MPVHLVVRMRPERQVLLLSAASVPAEDTLAQLAEGLTT